LKRFSSLFKSNSLSSFYFYKLEAKGLEEYLFKDYFNIRLSTSEWAERGELSKFLKLEVPKF